MQFPHIFQMSHYFTFPHVISTSLYIFTRDSHIIQHFTLSTRCQLSHIFLRDCLFFFPDVSYHSYRSKLFILTRKSPPFVLDWLLPHVDSLNFTFGSRSPVYSESTLRTPAAFSQQLRLKKFKTSLQVKKYTTGAPEIYIYLCRAAPAKIQLTCTACSVRAEKKDWECSDLPLSEKRQETISPRVTCLTFFLFVWFFFFIPDHYHVYSKTKPFFFR